jgi:hypothetical protein
MVECCVFFEVRSELLNFIQLIFGFKGLILKDAGCQIVLLSGYLYIYLARNLAHNLIIGIFEYG